MTHEDLLTEEELTSLREARSEQQWNSACDRIKGARQGQYPDDWFARVLMSGLLRRAQSTWKTESSDRR